MIDADTPAQAHCFIDIDPADVRPLDKFDETLREGFAKALTEQASRLDELAKQLIALELAIPGLYAAVLKLVSGDAAKLQHTGLIFFAFGCWLTALGLTFGSLLPGKYQVDIASLTDLHRFFKQSATRKLRLLIPAGLLCFLGICLVVIDIILA